MRRRDTAAVCEAGPAQCSPANAAFLAEIAAAQRQGLTALPGGLGLDAALAQTLQQQVGGDPWTDRTGVDRLRSELLVMRQGRARQPLRSAARSPAGHRPQRIVDRSRGGQRLPGQSASVAGPWACIKRPTARTAEPQLSEPGRAQHPRHEVEAVFLPRTLRTRRWDRLPGTEL